MRRVFELSSGIFMVSDCFRDGDELGQLKSDQQLMAVAQF
jgi:hypothetical protein